MNLNGLVGSLTGAINPQIIAGWQQSNGFAIGPGGVQVPQYKGSIKLPIQIQSLTHKDLMQLEGQNIQGVRRAIYINGQAAGVIRADQRGGDLLTFAEVAGGPIKTWLVVLALETWADWCKVAVTLQDDPNS